MKRIVLPTDFSLAAENAFHCAFKFFESEPCEYVLLHGLMIPNNSPEAQDWLMYRAALSSAEESLKILEARLQPLITSDRQHLRRVILDTNPVKAIHTMAETEQVDWVVLGATGLGEAILLGSVATDLIQSTTCNTLVIPVHVDPSSLIDVVFATDYTSLQTIDTLAPVRELVEHNHARLTLLTITTSKHVIENQQVRESTQHYFDGLNKQTVVEKHTDVLAGIVNYVDQNYIDLLVVISHHRSFLDAFLNRSLARKLAYRPLVPLAVLADRKNLTKPVVQLSTTDISL